MTEHSNLAENAEPASVLSPTTTFARDRAFQGGATRRSDQRGQGTMEMTIALFGLTVIVIVVVCAISGAVGLFSGN